MTIVLNQIAKRADGSDIVRTRRLDDDTVWIGRADDAGISLADLSLGLRHARLSLREGEVSVIAEAGASFSFNGKTVDQCVFAPGQPAVLGFGDHRLEVEAGGHPGEIVVTVTRVRAPTRGTGPAAEKVFSIRAGLLSKRKTAWALALGIALVALAWPIASFYGHKALTLQADAQWSTGHLSQAHAFLEDDCEACHQQAFIAVRDEACMTCHAAERSEPALISIAAQVRDQGSARAPLFVSEHAAHERLLRAAPPPRTLKARIQAMVARAVNRSNDRCASCHLEHQGPDAVPGEAVVPATLPATPTLKEVHGCVDCHAALKSRLADTPLVDTPDWPHHPEFRPLVLSRPDSGQARIVRASLTDRPVEQSGLVFPHALHLSAIGGVARMAQTLGRYGKALDCGDCHQSDPGGPGFAPVNMERDCSSCHSLAFGEAKAPLPHGEPDKVVAAIRAYYAAPRPVAPVLQAPRRRPGDPADEQRASLRANAFSPAPSLAERDIRTAFSEKGVCRDCHVVRPDAASAAGLAITPVRLSSRYLMRGTFDHRTDGHSQSTPGGPQCTSCHAAATSEAATDLLLPAIATCAQCHGKPKEEVALAAPADCQTCHGFHAPTMPTPGRGRPQITALSPSLSELRQDGS